MNIIRAQFMHQHKDKAMYEREILLGSPALIQGDALMPASFVFEIPLLLDAEPKWMFKWFNSSRNSRITRRSLRFVGSDGKILCELSKRPLKANMYVSSDFMTIHIRCAVDYGEAKELAKIFFK